MAFLTISDESGEIEAVAFPKVYEANHSLLQKGQQLFIEGSVEHRNESLQILVNKCRLLQDLKSNEQPTLFIKIDKDHQSPQHLNVLKTILDESKGTTSVVLIYEENRQKVQISQKINVSENLLLELQSVVGEGNVVFRRN